MAGTLIVLIVTVLFTSLASCQVNYQTVIACEGKDMALSCSTSNIQVTFANYGRTVGAETCPHAKISGRCSALQKSKDVMTTRCQGRQSCSVPATNAVFGDTCEDTYKYLEVVYACAVDPVCVGDHNEAMMVLGGYVADMPSNHVEVITRDGVKSDVIPSIPVGGNFWSAAQIGQQVVLCAMYGTTCYHLDLTKRSWVGTSTLVGRRWDTIQAFMLNGVFHIIRDTEVQKFNPTSKTWSVVPEWKLLSSMPVQTYCVVAHNNFVYTMKKKEMFRLSTATNKWEKMPNMLSYHDNPACTVTCIENDIGILVAGGKDQTWKSVKSTEFYSFKKNSWSAKADMNVARDGAGLVLLNGQPTVVGGSEVHDPPLMVDGVETYEQYHNSIEAYNAATNKWSVQDAKLSKGRRNFAYTKVAQWVN